MITPAGLLNSLGIGYSERTNRLAICCPFHHDTDPSSGFYLDTQLFHCFACELTLDMIGFYQRVKEIETRREAQREFEGAFGGSTKRLRGDIVREARERRVGEERLVELRSVLNMESHAFLGESLDRILMEYSRGHLSGQKLDIQLNLWYSTCKEAENGLDPRRASGVGSDGRQQEGLADLFGVGSEDGLIDMD